MTRALCSLGMDSDKYLHKIKSVAYLGILPLSSILYPASCLILAHLRDYFIIENRYDTNYSSLWFLIMSKHLYQMVGILKILSQFPHTVLQ